MASEPKRGGGYRKVGGLYLVGGITAMLCDRLPMPLTTCRGCGAGFKFSRGLTETNPFIAFGYHLVETRTPISAIFGNLLAQSYGIDYAGCNCANCFVCQPPNATAYIAGVGERHYKTPADFTKEALELGISKRIGAIPRKLVLGETVIYLSHKKACAASQLPAIQEALCLFDGEQPHLIGAEEERRFLGIFAAFIPQRVELLFWQREIDEMTKEEKAKLKKRGITPVGVPNGDLDHYQS